MSTPWPAPLADHPVRGRVTVPGSKSVTNRTLLLAALSGGESTLDGLDGLEGLDGLDSLLHWLGQFGKLDSLGLGDGGLHDFDSLLHRLGQFGSLISLNLSGCRFR